MIMRLWTRGSLYRDLYRRVRVRRECDGGSQARECRQPLEAGKGEEWMDLSEHLQKEPAPRAP